MDDESTWRKDCPTSSLDGEALTWDEEMVARGAVFAYRRDAPLREREQAAAHRFREAVFCVQDMGLLRFIGEYLRVMWDLWRYACPIEDYFYE